jgi:hypothetical protein
VCAERNDERAAEPSHANLAYTYTYTEYLDPAEVWW